jgi:hypothetical protein
LKQAELAAEAGLHTNSLRYWERHTTEPYGIAVGRLPVAGLFSTLLRARKGRVTDTARERSAVVSGRATRSSIQQRSAGRRNPAAACN